MGNEVKAAVVTGIFGVIGALITGLVTNQVSYKAGVEAGDSNAKIAISTAMENQGYISQTVNVSDQGTGEIITNLIEESKCLNEENARAFLKSKK